MRRRTIIKSVAGAGAAIVTQPALALNALLAPDWSALTAQLGDRLIRIRSPLVDCARAGGEGAEALFERINNPYYLGDEPGLTQTLGWTGAWTSQPSDFAVTAESAADIAAAVDFARRHGMRLVVKGGGHSYFGNSNGAGSLLVWTRRMRAIELHDDFVGQGCPANPSPIPAVSVGAGAIWGQVYDAVAVQAGRYVQGGGCLTVGVAGFVLGGGFGSLSKAFGTGAANLLEAEVVTADGQVRIANACHEPELFFALRGGGGGSFGVVTRLTLRTHELPATIGAVLSSITARSDAAWRALVGRIIAFYAEALFNPAWGEQIRFSPGRQLSVSMMFHGLGRDEAQAVWAPFLAWIGERGDDYEMAGEPVIIAATGRQFWDPAYLETLPGIVLPDDRPDAPSSNVFWAANLGEAGQTLHAYQSAWLPARLLGVDQQIALVDALVAASSIWGVALHTNKGLAGGTPFALARTRETATNPAVLNAFALLICAADAPPAWPGIPGHEPDLETGRRRAARVTEAMAPIRRLVPDAGAYVSESDYFERDWKRAYWGEHYRRLSAAKRRYDPSNLFRVHNGVEQS
ncbi:FAD-binding oxidoreductase [Sphingosinicella sp. LHD-64]|uniref:FAD-dependent oxidoreductase n=1 Tax=Sphingosinicella sp. LHD-64 TaxID=3072139 RepID=UPI00280CCF20|nr:FAD-binding oxidoreductase [Sphingosinicella sp. LHD-64]MDQ8756209.1 FAD-binding oxidoreductase [Sphingosinicella sp. LHD-64]